MRILIVDDDKAIADTLKTNFESECYAADAVYDGEAGSYWARVNDYDLVILDNIMPKKNGLKVCQEIRNSGKTTPIIMLSVKSEVAAKINLFSAGADDYMTKPFSFAELLSRVKAVSRRPAQLKISSVLKIDNLILDIDKHKVSRAGKEIHLTRKEFMLLQYLMENKGRALSRALIMEHVWDNELDPFSNTVETHILNLRKKIDSGKNRKLIFTISGRGYKMEE